MTDDEGLNLAYRIRHDGGNEPWCEHPLVERSEVNERLVCNTKPTLKSKDFNEPMKKIKMDFLELVSDEDSSSDYIPSDIDSEDSDEDSD